MNEVVVFVAIIAICSIAIMIDISGIKKALENIADKMKGGEE